MHLPRSLHPSIHSFIDGHLGSSHVLAVVKAGAMDMMYRYRFEILNTILLDIYKEVQLLDHKVGLFLIWVGTSILFSTVLAIFPFPPIVHRAPIPPHPPQHLLSFIYIHTKAEISENFCRDWVCLFILIVVMISWVYAYAYIGI